VDGVEERVSHCVRLEMMTTPGGVERPTSKGTMTNYRY
jgi:hypothetical protein